jgi:2-dehydro-3-deoxyphosphogluconate aldolase/(4S)-4-hydroxy-2-oxoglutarate aldolase
MSELFDRIGSIGVVPVISIEDAEHAVPLADALLEGGLHIADITSRARGAVAAVRAARGG